MTVGLGEWLIMEEGYAVYAGRMLEGGGENAKVGGREAGLDVDEAICEDAEVLLRWGFDDGGTCWNARVTSCKDILDGGPDPDGGGVPPSSDFIS